MATASPKLAILRHRPEFLAVAASGRKWATPGLVLQIGSAPDGHNNSILRFGLTASAKVGSAVVRNRARRRLRALISEILPRHAVTGFDYVVIARAMTAQRPYEDLQKDLMTALKKLNVWRDA